ncbi:SpoIIE family protein phosphatase [Thermodesulfobacteriota bacterium]
MVASRTRWIIMTLLLGLTILGPGYAGSSLAADNSHGPVELTPDEREWIRQHPVIRIGVDPDWPPLEFLGKGGAYKGIASEVVRIVGKHVGIRMEVQPGLSWQEVMAKVRKREIDVLPCVDRTPGRETYLLFTRPYMNLPVVIVTRTDAGYIGGLSDLHGKSLALIKGYKLYERLPMEFPGIDYHLKNSAQQALKAVSEGKTFAFAGNLATTSYLLPRLGVKDLKVAAPTSFSYKLSFAVRDDWPELVGILEKGLSTISPAERTSISQKWISLGQIYGIDYATVLKVVGIALAIIVVILLWNIQIRRQREAIRQSEEKLQTIMDSMPNVVFVTDPDGRKVLVNNEWERITGLKRSDAVGKTYDDLFSEELAEKFRSYDQRVLDTLEPLNTEETSRTKVGLRTYVYNMVPLKDAAGEPYAICGTTTDITERKHAEEQLAAAFAESSRLLAEAAMYVKTLLPEPVKDGPIRTNWRFIPSAALGGDSFGYHWLDDDHFAVYLVDVSGHGVSAALLAVTVINVLRSRTLKDTDFRAPDQVLSALNNMFPMEEQNSMYFTMWYGVYKKSAGTLTYSSGGHPPALLFTGDSSGECRVERLLTPNLFIGGMPGLGFEMKQVDLPSPCHLYLFSDGVYEVFVGENELWGLENFEEFIIRSFSADGSAIDGLYGHVSRLNISHALEDDFSILEVFIS